MISRRQLLTFSIALGLDLGLGVSQTAWSASATYPSKPIRFIVPFPPGGGSDYLARAVGKQLSLGLGQPVVIENRDGAGGSIGAEIVAKSAPDGYTILMGASATMAVNPHLYHKLPYDTLKDFTAVSLLATVPNVLFINKGLPVHSVQELIAYARANPGKLNFASTGNGSVGHLSGEMLKKMTGIDIVHIPFKGSAPAMTSLIGGQVQMMFDSPLSGMPHAKAGQVIALANGGAKRSDILPGMPTMAGLGLPDFRAILWYGLYVPAGTPADVIAKLNAAVVKPLHEPAVRADLERQTFEPVGSSAAECDAFWKADFKRWGAIIEASNIHLD